MIDMFRDCPDCGTQREFSQHHGEAGLCPDSADGSCPEWFCLACGAGLLIGLLPGTGGAAGSAEPLHRVA